MTSTHILKIDLDVKLNDEEYAIFEKTRYAILECLGYRVERVIKHGSGFRGHHIYIHFKSDKKLTPKDLNLLQLMCGDDQTRYYINKERISTGMSWRKANILFSRILERKEQ